MSQLPQNLHLSFNGVLKTIAERKRCQMLYELMKEDGLPAAEIGRRIGITPTNASKHMQQILRSGMVTRGYGNLYRIPAHFRVSGENTLDFGCIVLRLDSLKMSPRK